MTRAPQAMAAARPALRSGRRLSHIRPRSVIRLGWLAGLLVSIALSGCGPRPAKVTVTDAPARPLTQVLAAHTPSLMAIPGVVGTAEGRLADGRACVLVLASRLTPELRARVPRQLEGWPVRLEETGEIRAMPDTAR